MRRIDLQDVSLDKLIARFVDIGVAQYDAMNRNENAKFNRLFDRMTELMAEFLIRPLEQRRAVMTLYEHPNPQVRYCAAYITQDIAPQAARRVCEIIWERKEYPPAANAYGMIRNLDKGPVDMSWILKRAKRV